MNKINNVVKNIDSVKNNNSATGASTPMSFAIIGQNGSYLVNIAEQSAQIKRTSCKPLDQAIEFDIGNEEFTLFESEVNLKDGDTSLPSQLFDI